MITYPHAVDAFSRSGDGPGACATSGLPQLCDRLDSDENWPHAAVGWANSSGSPSPGHCWQSRTGFSSTRQRQVSIPRPRRACIISSKQRLPNATLVSIAHRPSVAQFHERRLVFKRDEGSAGTLAEVAIAPAGCRLSDMTAPALQRHRRTDARPRTVWPTAYRGHRRRHWIAAIVPPPSPTGTDCGGTTTPGRRWCICASLRTRRMRRPRRTETTPTRCRLRRPTSKSR